MHNYLTSQSNFTVEFIMNNYKNCYENIFDIKDAIFCLLINNKNQIGEISEEEEINYYYKVIENVGTILTS